MPAGGCEGDESYLGLHDYIEAFSTMNEPHFETFSTEDFLNDYYGTVNSGRE